MSALASDVYGGSPAVQPNSPAAAAGGMPHAQVGSGVEPIGRTSSTSSPGVLHKPFFFYVAVLGLAIVLIHASVHLELRAG